VLKVYKRFKVMVIVYWYSVVVLVMYERAQLQLRTYMYVNSGFIAYELFCLSWLTNVHFSLCLSRLIPSFKSSSEHTI